MDPLIKSKRLSTRQARHTTSGPDKIPCNSADNLLYQLTRGDTTRRNGSAGWVRDGSADRQTVKGAADEAHATQDRDPRMPRREEGHARLRRRATRPRRPRDGGRRKVLPRPISPCRREAPHSSRLMLGDILAAARDAVRAILGDVAKGRDPAAERKEAAREAKRKAAHEALTLERSCSSNGRALRLADKRERYAAEAVRAAPLRLRQAPERAGRRSRPRDSRSRSRRPRQGRQDRDGEPDGRLRPRLLPMGDQARLAESQTRSQDLPLAPVAKRERVLTDDELARGLESDGRARPVQRHRPHADPDRPAARGSRRR